MHYAWSWLRSSVGKICQQLDISFLHSPIGGYEWHGEIILKKMQGKPKSNLVYAMRWTCLMVIYMERPWEKGGCQVVNYWIIVKIQFDNLEVTNLIWFGGEEWFSFPVLRDCFFLLFINLFCFQPYLGASAVNMTRNTHMKERFLLTFGVLASLCTFPYIFSSIYKATVIIKLCMCIVHCSNCLHLLSRAHCACYMHFNSHHPWGLVHACVY